MRDGSRFADCSSGLMGDVQVERYKQRRDAGEVLHTNPQPTTRKSLFIGLTFLFAIIGLITLFMLLT